MAKVTQESLIYSGMVHRAHCSRQCGDRLYLIPAWTTAVLLLRNRCGGASASVFFVFKGCWMVAVIPFSEAHTRATKSRYHPRRSSTTDGFRWLRYCCISDLHGDQDRRRCTTPDWQPFQGPKARVYGPRYVLVSSANPLLLPQNDWCNSRRLRPGATQDR